MQLPNAKELAKLAAACRKAGIQTFKGGGIEFTLSDHLPEKPRTAKQAAASDSEDPTNEDLSQESLLHWSVLDVDQQET